MQTGAQESFPRCLRLVFATACFAIGTIALFDASFAEPDGRPHPSEAQPGGAATATNSTVNRNAFSHSSGNLEFAKEFDFKIGNAVFRKLWVSSPASTKSSDGLGPLYNARSCQRCHLKDGRGHPPNANWPADNAVSMFLKLSIPPQTDADRKALASGWISAVPEPTYGLQLQDFAIQGHAGEGRMEKSYRKKHVMLAGGETVSLRVPSYRITALGYGPLHPATMISPRIAPQMIGLGLLEAVRETDIIAGEDPQDQNGDGISGRANRIWSDARNRLMLGRFGWKAAKPDVHEQTVGAFSGDMGLSTPLAAAAFGDCTERQQKCRHAPHGAPIGKTEVPENLLRLVVFYSRNLAVPPRRNLDTAIDRRGRVLFKQVGCASCHTPSFTTGPSSVSPHLAGQRIWPYTDMLLHDMGDGLADNRPEGRASGREWRTPPLWGIGLTNVVSGHTYLLHDGRARNVKEAILWHDGEARMSRDAFSRLAKKDRERLIAFVNSL
ncbi:MAG: di-heme oxidoredictase family protein [Hyphomicrobiaceae bacterium]